MYSLCKSFKRTDVRVPKSLTPRSSFSTIKVSGMNNSLWMEETVLQDAFPENRINDEQDVSTGDSSDPFDSIKWLGNREGSKEMGKEERTKYVLRYEPFSLNPRQDLRK